MGAPRSSGPTCWPRRWPGSGRRRRRDELIAGLEPPDDGAAWVVSPELAIIGTLDFFPPIVDDPFTFGEIAAANALSDVFAMGGRVLFALSIAAFPEELPTETLGAVFAGASAKVREAGGVLAGGHTIRDPEPKYGLAVTGAAHPDRLLRKGGARPGDVLVLTKRLGTGLLVSGRRQGRTTERRLRRGDRPDADAQPGGVGGAGRRPGVRAATDVTGFGLLGHGLEMARASGVRFVFEAAAMPRLDGALDLALAGVETGGAAHNRRFVAAVADGRRRRPARARDPRPRPADERRPPRGDPARRSRRGGVGPRRRRRPALARRPGRSLGSAAGRPRLTGGRSLSGSRRVRP